jgi:hypothetical protein
MPARNSCLPNEGYTPILAVGDFLRERSVDMDTQQEQANGGMVG